MERSVDAGVRHAEEPRHLGQRHARDPGQPTRAPLQRRQGRDGREDGGAGLAVGRPGIGSLGRQIDSAEQGVGVEGGARGLALAPQPSNGGTEVLAGDVQDDPAQPRVEGVQRAQMAQPGEGAPKRLLKGVFGLVPVPGGRGHEREQGTPPRGDQRREGVGIAGLGPPNQQAILSGGHPGTPSPVKTQPMAGH